MTATENFVQPVWDAYRRLLKEEAKLAPDQWTFKSNPIYQQFLEHVTAEQAEAYLRELRSRPWWSPAEEALVAGVAVQNDRLGKPATYLSSLDGGIECSPSNLQYAWQATLLLEHLQAVGWAGGPVIELGGGYGGLALYVARLRRLLAVALDGYWLVDLPEAAAIQGRFCAQVGLDVAVTVVDGTGVAALQRVVSDTAGKVRCFVSCYGFGEFTPDAQARYHEHLARFCPRGFVIWNWTTPYPLYEGAPLTIVDEPIFTEPGTKVVTW